MIWVLIAIIVVLVGFIVYILKDHQGEIILTKDRTGKKIYSLVLEKEPEDIEHMRYVRFKVVKVAE
jgi:hypothetical protein